MAIFLAIGGALALASAGGGYLALRKKHRDEYDIIVSIASLQNLDTHGWKIRYPLLEREKDTLTPLNSGAGATVAVLGLYNRGKTWVLSQICDLELDNSYFRHTEGISFAIPRSDLGMNLMLIDTAGSQKPIQLGCDEGTEQVRRTDAKATETFLKSLALRLAGTVLVVVNRLTLDDQVYLADIKRKMQLEQAPGEHRIPRSLIVVHNFTHVQAEHQLASVIEEELVKCLALAKQTFVFMDKSRVAYYTASDDTKHVVLCQHNSSAGKKVNPPTFKLLQTWLQNAATRKLPNFNLVDEITKYTNATLSNYFTSTVSVEIKRDDGCIRPTAFVRRASEGAPAPPPMLVYRPVSYTELGTLEMIPRQNTTKATVYELEDKFFIIIDAPGLARSNDTISVEFVHEKKIRVEYRIPRDKDIPPGGNTLRDERRVDEGATYMREFEFSVPVDRLAGQFDPVDGQLKITLHKLRKEFKMTAALCPEAQPL